MVCRSFIERKKGKKKVFINLRPRSSAWPPSENGWGALPRISLAFLSPSHHSGRYSGTMRNRKFAGDDRLAYGGIYRDNKTKTILYI